MNPDRNGDGPLLCEDDQCRQMAIRYCKKCRLPVCLRHTVKCPGCAKIRKIKAKCAREYKKSYPFNARINRLPGDQWLFFTWVFFVVLFPALFGDPAFEAWLPVIAGTLPFGALCYCLFRRKYEPFEKQWLKARNKRTGGTDKEVKRLVKLNESDDKKKKTEGLTGKLTVLVFPSTGEEDEESEEEETEHWLDHKYE